VFAGSLSEVGDSWPLCGECGAVTGRTVLEYSFDMPSWCAVASHVVTFSDLLSLICTFFLVVVRLNLLVDLVYVYRSLVDKYPPSEML
jgi:hypothetical protein